MLNVKVAMTGKAHEGSFFLDRNATDAERKQKLTAFMAWVQTECQV